MSTTLRAALSRESGFVQWHSAAMLPQITSMAGRWGTADSDLRPRKQGADSRLDPVPTPAVYNHHCDTTFPLTGHVIVLRWDDDWLLRSADSVAALQPVLIPVGPPFAEHS